MSDSIESFSGRHASPLRERSSSPSLLAGVWLDASAFVSPPRPPSSKMLFAAAQEFSSVIARMRCGRQELSWGGGGVGRLTDAVNCVPVIISDFILIL